MTDRPGRSTLLEGFSCPLTGKPCEAGAPAVCDHFWQCIRQALADSVRGPQECSPRSEDPGAGS
ncbi:hypothetical protein LCGC14_0333450 [marine sediment metagenome]|uniref:Uncharacterized protein n=1 Tax=marine sediment metagenome TaxID=412755 RepID=A0A0F9TYK5_9ZZZZ